MEIERKWIVEGWPAGLPLLFEHSMRQGYISVRPTVRIREEAMSGGETQLILCFKSSGLLSRKEIEIPITQQQFAELEDLIGKPLIPKIRRTYELPDGNRLEVSVVDSEAATGFWYAEVEYETEEQALSWDPSSVGLESYLSNEVTGQAGQSMGAYWMRTRLESAE